MSLMNISGAGRFAADRAINDYARDIWHTKSAFVAGADAPKAVKKPAAPKAEKPAAPAKKEPEKKTAPKKAEPAKKAPAKKKK